MNECLLLKTVSKTEERRDEETERRESETEDMAEEERQGELTLARQHSREPPTTES